MTDTEREDREILARWLRERDQYVLARWVEVGKLPSRVTFSIGDVLTAMSLARDAQREADARIANEEPSRWPEAHHAPTAKRIAAAIRAKKEKP